MKISENFELKEFTRSNTATQKGIANDPGVQEVKAIENLVINLLQPLRETYGKRMVINSGYRCPELNKAVGGVATSSIRKGRRRMLLVNIQLIWSNISVNLGLILISASSTARLYIYH